MEKTERKNSMKIIITVAAVILAAVLLIIIFALKTPSEYTLGKNIKTEDVTEFYFTRASSTNPPYYQRFRLYFDGDKCMLYHEKREGDSFPLTENDITASGDIELTKEEQESLFNCLDGGKVQKRIETADSGSDGPFTYLYWKGDGGKYQEFTFASYGKQTEFETLCTELKDKK